MMMRHKYTIFAFIIFCLFGCKLSIEKKILKQLERIDFSKRNDHTLLMREITDFEWDKMYLFSNWTSADSIETTIDLEYHREDVPDSYSRMIFVNRNRIVYEEDFKSLDYNNSAISFQTSDNSTFYTGRNYLTQAMQNLISLKLKLKEAVVIVFSIV